MWNAPALNTVMLRFTEDEGCVDPDAAVVAPVQRHRHHHLRPSRHADARLGCDRRRRQERPVDPGPHRVPAHDPAHAGGSAEAGPGGARRRAASSPRRPSRTRRSSSKPTKSPSTRWRTRRGKVLQTPDATEAELNTACEEVAEQVESDPANVSREQGLECREYTAAFETVEADQKALEWTRDVGGAAPERERRTAHLRAELRALPHRGLVDVRPGGAGRRARRRRLARSARRRRWHGRRHRVQPARRQ